MRRLSAAVLAVAVLAAGEALAHEGRHGPLVVEPQPGWGSMTRVDPKTRTWLAGDHHVHSQFSVGWRANPDGTSAPEPILAGDARYPIPTNAEQGVRFGLSWMVATDHGGPNHSKLNRDLAYPELLKARQKFPQLIQFYGMELDTPAAEHSSVIIPKTPAERDVLFDIESRFNRREPWPEDPKRNTEPAMIEALRFMAAVPAPPVVIANHPARTAKAIGAYGLVSPHELRAWNDAAPKVAVGMEGAPGHQAGGLNPAGDADDGFRGAYRAAPTLGGFDQMTARLGGFWDSMLSEGRRWWITSTSDSHRHYTEGGSDFWPGEYSKTYVKAARTPGDILDGLRNGRVFVTLGDLISELDVIAMTQDGRARAEIGGTLRVQRGEDVTVVIRLRDPAGQNFGGRSPEVTRVDLIRGEVSPGPAPPEADTAPATRVERRFSQGDWLREGERLSMVVTLRNVTGSGYLRVRGTNGAELEPQVDTAGENPWDDLWFYGNPIFLEVQDATP